MRPMATQPARPTNTYVGCLTGGATLLAGHHVVMTRERHCAIVGQAAVGGNQRFS